MLKLYALDPLVNNDNKENGSRAKMFKIFIFIILVLHHYATT